MGSAHSECDLLTNLPVFLRSENRRSNSIHKTSEQRITISRLDMLEMFSFSTALNSLGTRKPTYLGKLKLLLISFRENFTRELSQDYYLSAYTALIIHYFVILDRITD